MGQITRIAMAVAAGPTASGEPSAILYLLGGGSLVTISGMVGAAFKGWYTGKTKEAIRRDADLVLQRDTAWRERDAERRARQRAERNLRHVESHAGQLIYLLHRNGVPADEIPAYPQLEQEPPPAPDTDTPSTSN